MARNAPIKRITIAAIIEEKIDRLISLMEYGLKRFRKNQVIEQGLIVSGDLVSIEGLLESIEQKIGLPVTLGRVEVLACRDLQYASCLGAVIDTRAQIPHFHPFTLDSYGN
ncbi:MAG: cell division FtsA domain-containing protein, partial [Planctomycetales bacterium]|nr:cell division FtsA domain-containing protein [Planctomycetales bacterium]